MFQIEVHSKTDCPHCADAKSYLDQRGVPYEVVMHDDDLERQAFYDSLGLASGDRTVPQINVVDPYGYRERIGGHDTLKMSGLESLFRKSVEHPPAPLEPLYAHCLAVPVEAWPGWARAIQNVEWCAGHGVVKTLMSVKEAAKQAESSDA